MVSSRTLIDALWGYSPPPTASKGVQVHVSNLRKKLPAGIIETAPPGYRLTIDPAGVDALHFTSLLEAAAEEVDPRTRAAILSDALSLWRGAAFEDLADHDLGRNEATRLEEMRLSAEEQRFEALLAAGEDHALVAGLRAAVGAEPLREERWAQLMIALFRSGQRSDALRAFQRLHQFLVQEIGVEPGSRVTTLESMILRDDASLLWLGSDEAAAGRTLPLPGRLATISPSALLGRMAELEEISDAFKRASEGHGLELLLITGEPGIGKSTLMAEAAREAHSLGAVVLFGHGDEELLSPYQLFAEAFTHYVNHADYRDLAKLRPHAAPLIPVVPDLRRRLPGLSTEPPSDPAAERYVLLTAALRALEAICREVPLFLAFDDLHWADQASLLLLRYLITTGAAIRVLVVATYRPDGSATLHDRAGTIGVLRQHPRFREIALQGFTPSEIASLLEMSCTRDADSADILAEAMYAETDGNPLFVTELVRQLANRPDGADGQPFLPTSGTPPTSLADIITARVHRLGRDGPDVLMVASVIGQAFDVELLAKITGQDDLDVLDILEAATRSFLVREMADSIGRFEFTHLLIRRILHASVGATRRSMVHRLAAEALEDLGATSDASRAAELAGHWAQSASKEGRGKAVSLFRRAGDDALDRLAPADAARYYTQALELIDEWSSPDPLEVVDLKIGSGVARRQLGEPGAREVLLEAATEALAQGDGKRLFRAVLENDRGFFSAFGQLDTEKVAMLEAALEQSPENSADRALVLATYCQELTFASPLPRRLHLAEEAIFAARATGDPTTLVRVLNRVDGPLRVPQELARSLARSAEAQQHADAIADPVLRFWAATSRRTAAAQAGDLAEVDRCLRITEQLAQSVGQPTMTWVSTYARATRVLLAGELGLAEQLANQAFQIGSEGDEPDAFPVLAAQLLSINSQRGTMGQMVPLIEQAIDDNPGLPVFWSVLAAAHVEADRPHLARPILEEASNQGFALPMNVGWLTGIVTYAEAAIECGEPRFAEPLFEMLLPWADLLSYNDVTVEGPVSHYLGGLARVLHRHQQAAELFDAATRFSDRIGAPCFGARTRLSWARMLLDRGQASDGARAQRLLREALDASQRGGYGTTIRRATQLLKRS